METNFQLKNGEFCGLKQLHYICIAWLKILPFVEAGTDGEIDLGAETRGGKDLGIFSMK